MSFLMTRVIPLAVLVAAVAIAIPMLGSDEDNPDTLAIDDSEMEDSLTDDPEESRAVGWPGAPREPLPLDHLGLDTIAEPDQEQVDLALYLALQEQNAELRNEVGRLLLKTSQFEQEQLSRPGMDGSPYEEFLKLPDAEILSREEQRRWIEGRLGSWPVVLMPGEAVMLYDSLANYRWRAYSDDPDKAFVTVFGYNELLSRLPPENAALLRALYGPAIADN